MVLLDTDHLSLLARQDSPAATKLRERLAAHASEELGTTIINFEEQMRGWMAFLGKARKVKEQVEAYRRLSQHLELFRKVPLIAEFNEHAAIEFQRLKKEHRRIGTMDLKIAAIAIVNRAVLLTRNERDFRQIPGLTVEDWTE